MWIEYANICKKNIKEAIKFIWNEDVLAVDLFRIAKKKILKPCLPFITKTNGFDLILCVKLIECSKSHEKVKCCHLNRILNRDEKHECVWSYIVSRHV